MTLRGHMHAGAGPALPQQGTLGTSGLDAKPPPSLVIGVYLQVLRAHPEASQGSAVGHTHPPGSERPGLALSDQAGRGDRKQHTHTHTHKCTLIVHSAHTRQGRKTGNITYTHVHTYTHTCTHAHLQCTVHTQGRVGRQETEHTHKHSAQCTYVLMCMYTSIPS